jgi:hypothetical protein
MANRNTSAGDIMSDALAVMSLAQARRHKRRFDRGHTEEVT